jgi:hypothetical protein
MEKYKPAIISGVCGFGLSLLVALVSGVRPPALLLRPLIFGGVFFFLGMGTLILFRRFLAVPSEHGALGSNVDISLDDDNAEMMSDGDGNYAEGEFSGSTGMDDSYQNDIPGKEHDKDETNGPGQDGKGLEQNSRIGYTDDGENKDGSFKLMDFNVMNDSTVDAFEKASLPVEPPFAGNRKVYAKVSDSEKIANADPKKLASTVQGLLLDE